MADRRVCFHALFQASLFDPQWPHDRSWSGARCQGWQKEAETGLSERSARSGRWMPACIQKQDAQRKEGVFMMDHSGWMGGSMGSWLPICILIAALVIAGAILENRRARR